MSSEQPLLFAEPRAEGSGEALAESSVAAAAKPGARPGAQSSGAAVAATFASSVGVAGGAAYVLSTLIHRASPPPAAEVARLSAEVQAAWSAHVNPAFLAYRKSVTATDGDSAALEWRDGPPGGWTLFDARGHEYVDLLGGFGVYSCGHSHPVVVGAVRAQLEKQPLHSQELVDPLRAYAAELLCRSMPGALKGGYVFWTNSGSAWRGRA